MKFGSRGNPTLEPITHMQGTNSPRKAHCIFGGESDLSLVNPQDRTLQKREYVGIGSGARLRQFQYYLHAERSKGNFSDFFLCYLSVQRYTSLLKMKHVVTSRNISTNFKLAIFWSLHVWANHSKFDECLNIEGLPGKKSQNIA